MDPSDPVVAIDIGDLLLEWNESDCVEDNDVCKERRTSAEAEYRRALELAPDNPEAHARLATFLESVGRDLSAAKRHIELALEYQPWAPKLHLVAGLINQALFDEVRARVHLERTLQWSENEEERQQAATALTELDDV